MIPRTLTQTTQQYLSWFPIISITGPRQSGKSTLLRNTFPNYEYVNLENPNTRAIAQEDPIGFIQNHSSQLIIDEAQYVPDLFSMVQVLSDERQKTGQYILSGSQNFLLLKQIKQSLAGRVGLLKLLPFSYQELHQSDSTISIEQAMVQGGYPRLYDVGIDTDVYYGDYIETYIERDVAGYLDVRDSTSFKALLRLCAANAGNLINYSNLAKDADISYRTAKSWLSILESSYITFSLMPWSTNIGKRLTKTPKLYFYDTGLLCYLLGIHTPAHLLNHPMLGAIFENFIISETIKKYYNRGKRPELYFYRDDTKQEIDLLDFTNPDNHQLIEIKASQTYHSRFAKTITHIGNVLGIPAEQRIVVYRGAEEMASPTHTLLSASHYVLFNQ